LKTRLFRGFQLRLLFCLIVVGSVPVVIALTILYVRLSAESEAEWRRDAAGDHARVAARIAAEWDRLDYVYQLTKQDAAFRSYAELSAAGERADEAKLSAVKQDIRHTVELHAAHDRYLRDLCIVMTGSGPFCARHNPLQYDLVGIRAPVSQTDVYYVEEAPLWVKLVGPLYGETSPGVFGYAVLVMDMGKLMDDLQAEFSLGRHVIWDKATGTILFGRAADDQYPATYAFIADGNELVRADRNVLVSQKRIVRNGIEWMSYVEFPKAKMKSLTESLSGSLAILLPLIVALSAGVSLSFARLFLKPLDRLRALMKRAELGDLKAYWTSGAKDEIGELGESYNQMLNRLEEVIRQAKREEALKKEAELEALQYQLNPHFLYNTLNTIKWVAKIYKTPQISEAVSALVRLLQASLGKKGDFLTVREEVGLIRDYMDIQSFRYGDRVRLELDIDPLAAQCLVPKLIMQPVVENALLHGFEHGEGGQIKITARIDRDTLVCEIRDNGKGMPEFAGQSAPPSGQSGYMERMSGIGLRHIQQKIKMYYGPDFGMQLFSKPNEGTTVKLTFPIHRVEE